jgi:hypothetical protein
MHRLHQHCIRSRRSWTNTYESCHLHAFEVASLRLGAPDREGDPDDHTISENGITLAEALLGEESTLHYNYDFGDGWDHEITLEAIVPAGSEATCPRVLEGARSCPPEDCGGPPGYADLLRILKHPKNKQYAHVREWAGAGFNPEAFSREDINLRLRRNRSLAAKP